MTRLRPAIAPVLLLLLLAAPAATSAPPASPTKAPADFPLFDSESDSEMMLQSYLDVCRKSNRRCIAVFGTNGCDPCRVVADGIYEHRFYIELLKQFVPFFVAAEPGTPGGEIPARYGIDPKAPYPGVVIFDPKGTVTEVLRKGEMAEIAKKGKEAVQLWLIDRFEKTKPD